MFNIKIWQTRRNDRLNGTRGDERRHTTTNTINDNAAAAVESRNQRRARLDDNNDARRPRHEKTNVADEHPLEWAVATSAHETVEDELQTSRCVAVRREWAEPVTTTTAAIGVTGARCAKIDVA